MKTCLLFLLIFPCFTHAQDIALLDRSLKKPVGVTQKLTHEHMKGKKFPVYTADLDLVIQVTEQLAGSIITGTPHVAGRKILEAGHSQFAVTTKVAGAGTLYSISLTTRAGDIGASLDLVTEKQGHKKAVQQLQTFLDYLKNNRHMVVLKK